MLTPDTLLQGRYRVIRLISQGGMGAVYLARHIQLDNEVALKETFFAKSDDDAREQFHREARLLSRLRHNGLPRVTDHFIEGNGQFLVMDYIVGQDLQELMRASGEPFSVGKVLEWAAQLLDVLGYLHAQDEPVIHRDIKPANIKLTPRGEVILLDFGLAKGSSVSLQMSFRAATPAYAPLEQLTGQGTDARSDLYSLAVTLYHLLTAQLPPTALERIAAVGRGRADHLVPANTLNPQVPAGVAGALMQAMSLDPGERPANASEMRDLLIKDEPPTSRINTVVETPPASRTDTVVEVPPTIVERGQSNKPAITRLPFEDTRQVYGYRESSGIAAIDIGNTKTVVSLNGRTWTVPSVVAFDETGKLLIGVEAKKQAVLNYENTFYFLSRLIAKSGDAKISENLYAPFKLSQSLDGSVKVVCPALKRELTAEEILACLLYGIIENVNNSIGERVTKAVVAVPSSYSLFHRDVVRRACEASGINVLRFVTSTSAVALAYNQREKLNQTVAIIDFGSGKLDVSVLEIGEGIVEVRAKKGDVSITGDAIDQVITNWIIKEFERDQNLSLSKDRMALARINQAAESAKLDLTSASAVDINLPYLTADGSGPKHLAMTLTRAKFEQLTQDLLERAVSLCRSVLSDAWVRPEQVNKVLLSGGSSRLPTFRQMIREYFKREPSLSMDQEEVVAAGTSINADILGGSNKDTLLLDVWPASLGIEISNGACIKVIERNTTIPTKKSALFTTAADNQTAMDIHLVEGESEVARRNRTIGVLRLRNIAPAPRGKARIEVAIEIDANSIRKLSATNLDSMIEEGIEINDGSALSEQDLRSVKMLPDFIPESVQSK